MFLSLFVVLSVNRFMVTSKRKAHSDSDGGGRVSNRDKLGKDGRRLLGTNFIFVFSSKLGFLFPFVWFSLNFVLMRGGGAICHEILFVAL